MINPILDAALKERTKLISILEANPTFRQLQAVEGVIAAYQGGPQSEDKRQQVLPLGSSSENASQPNGSLPSTKVGRVEYLAKECIRRNGGYAQSKDILELLSQHNIPMSRPALSSYLSTFKTEKKEIDYDRDRGWYITNQNIQKFLSR